MKKNKFLRIASAMLVCALISVCAVSNTFAKYVTKTEGTDTARVAKWGFKEGTVTLDELFKTAYDANVNGAADVIAPGTTNNATFGFTFDNAGGIDAPEVAYDFTVDTTGSDCAADIKNNVNIQWQLNGGAWGTWDDLLANIKKLSGDDSGTKRYNAGELPAGFGTGVTNTVAWKWEFYTADAADTTDTAMGNKAALDTVTVKITVSATQVD